MLETARFDIGSLGESPVDFAIEDRFACFMIQIARSINLLLPVILLMTVGTFASPSTHVVVETSGAGLATIRGSVHDDAGSPIADATVAIFKVGTSTLLKQVKSAADGSFLARIIPGTYTVLAVAQGFNPATVAEVEVANSASLSYGFKLERAGSGNTLPEKKADRNNPKWVRRSAALSRSIYQNTEGNAPSVETEAVAEVHEEQDDRGDRKGQTVVETYFGSTDRGAFTGVNVATLLPVAENAELILAGQAGVGRTAAQRFEAQLRFRPNHDHQLRLNASAAKLGTITFNDDERALGQFSFQALDEWKVREGIVVVFGLDYSRFVGAGDDSSITPRLGFQYDLDAKTRFTTAFASHTEPRTWTHAVELEDAQVFFREPVAVEDIVLDNGNPLLNKSTRFEFAIQRVIDNDSNLEAKAFFDMALGRGIGLAALPFDSPSGAINNITGNQQGKAQGISLIYNRRLGGRFSTAAGYSFGSGQKLSTDGITNPADLFERAFFQSFFGQVEADLRTGTSVKTIFRLSPEATVFAIDPFQGRLAIYDPSLSVMVTQSLPNLGLPFRAQAVVDARNLFDFQTGVSGEDGSLRVNSQGRALRGSILVRF